MSAVDPNAAWKELLSPVEQVAWYGFLRTYATLVRELDDELQQAHGLPLTSYDVLVQLSLAPERQLSMSDLADRVLLSPSGLTRLVERLERRGMVTRRPGASDSRQVFATVTPSGLAWLAAAEPVHVAGIRRRFFDQLSPDQVRCLATVWTDVVPALAVAVPPLHEGAARGEAPAHIARTPEEVHRLWGETMNAGDLDGVVALYEPEASVVAQPGQVVTGTAAVRATLQGLLALTPRIEIAVREVAVAGELALLISPWTLTGSGPDGAVELTGTTSDVVRRQPDGSWKFIIDNPFGSA